MRKPFRLPRAYLRLLARKSARDPELELDWRALARKRPPMWPGTLYLYRRNSVDRENAELQARLFDKRRRFFIGSNAAGLVFALDPAGRVSVLDEIGMDEVVLAQSFEKLLRSAHLDETPAQRRARLERYASKAPAMWKKLHAEASSAKRCAGWVVSDLFELRDWARELGGLEEFEERLEVLRRKAKSREFRRHLDQCGFEKRAPAVRPKTRFPLPPNYPEVVARCGVGSVRLDWRRLSKRKPRRWSGEVLLFTQDYVSSYNRSLRRKLDPRKRDKRYFIGNDTAGLLLALDERGAVVSYDGDFVERPFAPSFDALAAAIGLKKS